MLACEREAASETVETSDLRVGDSVLHFFDEWRRVANEVFVFFARRWNAGSYLVADGVRGERGVES